MQLMILHSLFIFFVEVLISTQSSDLMGFQTIEVKFQRLF